MIDANSNSQFRLDRALRLEDFLLSSSAIPLSTSLTPAWNIEQDSLTSDAARLDHEQSNRADAKDLPSQHATDAPLVQETHDQDGLTASLQASADAIHRSLAHDVPSAPSDDVTAHFTQESHTAIAADAGQIANTQSTIGEGLAETATAFVMPSNAILNSLDIAHLDAPVTQFGQLAWNAMNAAGALTVPSLNGVGFDSLVGLVQPPAVPLALVAPIVGTAITTIDHPIISAPIGLEEIHTVDNGVAHLVHPVTSLIGSGLI